nr:peptidoglycan binding domain-containing protein [Clostridium punense]
MIISLYFAKHFFFNIIINGVDVSLKPQSNANDKIINYIKDYKLQLIERNGEIEEISAQDIEMSYNEKNSIYRAYQNNNSFKWIISLVKKQEYYIEDLFTYNKDILENKIGELACLNKDIIEPKNASFSYSSGSYEVVEEVYGNKVNKENLIKAIEESILKGEAKLDLNQSSCYENPKYTMNSDKTIEARELLNKYIKTKITYIFGTQTETLDENTINQWLNVNESLEVVVDEKEAFEYVLGLSKKYDTVGRGRNLKTSTGKTLEVKGGFYGWKIDCSAETKELLQNIKNGDTLEKEPIYTQKAITRGENDIGNTYVEINITRQHLWFYKNGKLITQGSVVTGNPNRGNSTKLGIYMLNYKEKGSTLRGHDYEAEVTYWMPFNGNIGIHDASWRYSFGGQIYKNNGTHGCVNAPIYLAKTIYENIEPGTPVICYEE